MPPPRARPLSPSLKENRAAFRRSPRSALPSRPPLSPVVRDNRAVVLPEHSGSSSRALPCQKDPNRTPLSEPPIRDVRRKEKTLSDVKRVRFWGEAPQEAAGQHERIRGGLSLRMKVEKEPLVPRVAPKASTLPVSGPYAKPQNNRSSHKVGYDTSRKNPAAAYSHSLWSYGQTEDQGHGKASHHRKRALSRGKRVGFLRDAVGCAKERSFFGLPPAETSHRRDPISAKASSNVDIDLPHESLLNENCSSDVSFDVFLGEGAFTADARKKDNEELGHAVIGTPPEALQAVRRGGKDLLAPTEKNPTPPMQPTSSPDFIKRGERNVGEVGQACFGAGRAMVKDKRKCKPRGVLTVDHFHEFQSSTESEVGFRQSVQMPTPSLGSVEWMADVEDIQIGLETSSDFTSSPMDLCRMSFGRLSIARFDEEKEDESKVCNSLADMETYRESKVSRALQKSVFDLEASSSQGMHSSSCTQASPSYQKGSFVLGEQLSDRPQCKGHLLASLSPGVRREILTQKKLGDNGENKLFGGFPVYQGFLKSKSMPDFPVLEAERTKKHLLLTSFQEPAPLKELSNSVYSQECACLEEMDLCKEEPWLKPLDIDGSENQEPWANSPQKEIFFSMAKSLPHLDISTSSYEQVVKPEVECQSIRIPTRASKSFGGEAARDSHRTSYSNSTLTEMHFEEICQSESQFSSRIAMAELLCDLTAAYLEKVKAEEDRCLAGVQLRSCNGSQYLVDQVVCNMPKQECKSSSMSRGRSKMDNCHSLLRGLTIESPLSQDNSSMLTEYSVNQASVSVQEDSADSSFCLSHNFKKESLETLDDGQSRLTSSHCRSFVNLDADPNNLEEILLKLSDTLRHQIINSRQEDMCFPSSVCQVRNEVWIPSRATVAITFLLIGAVAVSYSYHKHHKQSRKF